MTTTESTERLDRAFVKLAAILLIGIVAVTFDTTIVNVALETIGREMHTTVSAMQWTVTGFVLSMAMVMPISGWAMSRFGDKQMWLFSLGLFLLGSVLTSLAPNIGLLIAFRVVQGAGGGLMIPIMQTLLVAAAGSRPMGQVMALTGIVAVTGPILGPVAGGLIVEYLNWRWIFWINVPFCVIAMILAWLYLQPSERRPAQRLDLLGLALLSPALALVIYGLSQLGVRHGFTGYSVLGPLILGVILLAVYVAHALHVSDRAVIDVRLFAARPFAASASMLFLSGIALYGAMLLLPLYYQQVRGQSPLAAGLLLAPQGLGSLIARRRTGKLSDQFGPRRVVLIGYLLAILGTVAYTQAGPHMNEILLALSLVIRGIGLGAVAIPVMASAYQGLEKDQIPHASSTTRIMQQLGGSFGTAVLAVVLQIQLTAHPAAADTAFNNAFWWSVAFTSVALLPALTLPGKSVQKAGNSAAPEKSKA